MLKQELEQKLNTPTMFVKRDGAKYPFELFKLEMVIHALGLDDVKTVILSKIMDKLDDDTVTAQDVADAFRQSLNELGYIEAAKSMLLIASMTLPNGKNKLILRTVWNA